MPTKTERKKMRRTVNKIRRQQGRPSVEREEATPSIVRLAAQIANTESAIDTECTRNVQIQMKLNESNEQLSNLRRVLAGLHREMDKFTAGTRVR